MLDVDENEYEKITNHRVIDYYLHEPLTQRSAWLSRICQNQYQTDDWRHRLQSINNCSPHPKVDVRGGSSGARIFYFVPVAVISTIVLRIAYCFESALTEDLVTYIASSCGWQLIQKSSSLSSKYSSHSRWQCLLKLATLWLIIRAARSLFGPIKLFILSKSPIKVGLLNIIVPIMRRAGLESRCR